mmetsp:Transcript_30791/g.52016  ORF Transcript_30791/g.52016 Transcript_30791/m.52016 type:complete len:246 (-) Transcript_30791:409-1146(-)
MAVVSFLACSAAISSSRVCTGSFGMVCGCWCRTSWCRTSWRRTSWCRTSWCRMSTGGYWRPGTEATGGIPRRTGTSRLDSGRMALSGSAAAMTVRWGAGAARCWPTSSGRCDNGMGSGRRCTVAGTGVGLVSATGEGPTRLAGVTRADGGAATRGSRAATRGSRAVAVACSRWIARSRACTSEFRRFSHSASSRSRASMLRRRCSRSAQPGSRSNPEPSPLPLPLPSGSRAPRDSKASNGEPPAL